MRIISTATGRIIDLDKIPIYLITKTGIIRIPRD